jgi:hypothetical protein
MRSNGFIISALFTLFTLVTGWTVGGRIGSPAGGMPKAWPGPRAGLPLNLVFPRKIN